MAAHRPRVFDLRYHIASLAAVFLALAVGIVVGVAISDPVEDAESALAAQEIEQLRQELEDVRESAIADEVEEAAIRDLLAGAYPLVMERRLAGRSVALIFLGPVDGDVRSAVEQTLADAGAGRPVRVVALGLPIDLEAVDAGLAGVPELTRFAGGDGYDELGRTLGRELVAGSEAPVLSTLAGALVDVRTGDFTAAADAAVVVRSWVGPEDGGADPALAVTDDLLDGVMRGLEEASVPAVGVELAAADASWVADYRARGLSSVDDVDTTAGRVALAVLLAGGRPGHYGVKDTAEAVVPPIPVVEAPPADGS
jgi:hypothetical protein